MTRDDIIRMAREAGIDWHKHWNDDESNRLEVFAALVAAAERERVTAEVINEAQREVQRAVFAEREACAKVCEEWFTPNLAAEIAAAIRARSKE